MPLGKGVKYRMKPMKAGGYERLAFKGNTVVETKNMKSGAVHSASEFKADAAAKGLEFPDLVTTESDNKGRRKVMRVKK